MSFRSASLHFVSGKGGVGKSTAAMALAHYFSSQGESTILVELSDASYAHMALHLPEAPSYKPTEILPNLSIAKFDGLDCLKEYATYLLKSQTIANLFLENKVLRTFVNIAPALKEIAILGKLTSHIRHHGPSLSFSKIVVDSPATGHFLSLMRAPRGLANAIRFGPMGEQSRSIQKVLANDSQVHFWITSLPEDFSIQESGELYNELKSDFGFESSFILNRAFRVSVQKKKPASTDLEREIIADFTHRQEETQAAIQSLRSLNKNLLEIPWIFLADPKKIVTTASRSFDEFR